MLPNFQEYTFSSPVKTERKEIFNKNPNKENDIKYNQKTNIKTNQKRIPLQEITPKPDFKFRKEEYYYNGEIENTEKKSTLHLR